MKHIRHEADDTQYPHTERLNILASIFRFERAYTCKIQYNFPTI